MLRILGWEGADPWTLGNFYKAVVQATLLFGEDTWVMYPRIGRTLSGFHHRVALRMANMNPRRDMMFRWVYPTLYEAMAAVGVEEVETYVLRRHNTSTQYIATPTIMEICLAAEIWTGAQVTMI